MDIEGFIVVHKTDVKWPDGVTLRTAGDPFNLGFREHRVYDSQTLAEDWARYMSREPEFVLAVRRCRIVVDTVDCEPSKKPRAKAVGG
jgi:hypothetical protein